MTEEEDNSEFKSGRISDLVRDEKARFTKQKYKEDEEEKDDKDSNSDENSEKLALKSSSTEYNFYNSDESRGQSILSSNSSNIQPFKRGYKESKNFNGSLGIVREVSNNAIEEDPDEDINTSKDPSSSDHTKNLESKFEELAIEKDENSLSNLSQKSDVEKIIESMKDLMNRCDMIMSFYEERRNFEIIPQERELAYLCNRICYDLKVFITTLSNQTEIKDDTILQII